MTFKEIYSKLTTSIALQLLKKNRRIIKKAVKKSNKVIKPAVVK